MKVGQCYTSGSDRLQISFDSFFFVSEAIKKIFPICNRTNAQLIFTYARAPLIVQITRLLYTFIIKMAL